MIEKIIFDYLNEVLDVPAVLQRPEDAPEAFVFIEKTGSSRYNRINTATIALQSYAGRLEDAALLNERVKAAMDDAIELGSISESSLNSDYYFPDTTKHNYRYQAIYSVVFY